MTALIAPSTSLLDSWADCVRDFDGAGLDGSGAWLIDNFGPDEDTLSALLEVVREEACTARPLPAGRVHCDYFWIAEPADAVIGFLAVRHSLDNDFLRREGGHIGYSVRPSRRREGHASRALGLALDHARTLCLARVLVTCDETNEASARTIERQGGVFESHVNDKRRYWIDL